MNAVWGLMLIIFAVVFGWYAVQTPYEVKAIASYIVAIILGSAGVVMVMQP